MDEAGGRNAGDIVFSIAGGRGGEKVFPGLAADDVAERMDTGCSCAEIVNTSCIEVGKGGDEHVAKQVNAFRVDERLHDIWVREVLLLTCVLVDLKTMFFETESIFGSSHVCDRYSLCIVRTMIIAGCAGEEVVLFSLGRIKIELELCLHGARGLERLGCSLRHFDASFVVSLR